MRQATLQGFAAVIVVVGYLAASVPTAQQPQPTKSFRFEVAAIRPSNPRGLGGVGSWSSSEPTGGLFRLVNMPLKQWVEMALSVRDYALKAPSWLDASRFDLDARLPAGKPDNRREAIAEMMKALLIERFGLKWHEERRIVSGYELVAGRKVLIKASGPAERGASGYGRALIDGTDMPMSELAAMLGDVLGRPVADATHLSGGFDIRLRWLPFDAARAADAKQRGMKDVDNLPSIFTAVREQLGLRLRSAKVPLNIFVVDHIDRQPTEN
jgi:uncharacterized protein (TIGR03435 family)